MDYKRVLRLHFVNHLSGREIAESCGDCSKTTVNEFLKRFRECPELTYPLSEDVTNEYIAGLLYKKPGIAADQLLYRDFNKEAVYKALARKGETLKHLWQKYNAVGIVDGKKPMSYRQYCRRYSEWVDSKQLTFHIQRYPGVNLELDYAGKQLYLHNRRNPEETTKVTIFIAALTYSDYFYAEGMTECDIRNWIRVNNNALAYFGGITPTVTPDNCKVAVAKNKDWINPIYDFGGLAEILYEVIKEVEEIDLLLCTDSGDKTYLIYTPSYPWTPKTEKEKELTEEKLENMFRKYLRIVTDEQLPVDYKSVENFS